MVITTMATNTWSSKPIRYSWMTMTTPHLSPGIVASAVPETRKNISKWGSLLQVSVLKVSSVLSFRIKLWISFTKYQSSIKKQQPESEATKEQETRCWSSAGGWNTVLVLGREVGRLPSPWVVFPHYWDTDKPQPGFDQAFGSHPIPYHSTD